MAELRISPDLSLPPEAVTETFAILAKRGAGKTYTASVLVEELLKAGLPVAAVDPVGVWWGLRSSATGKSEGFPITVFGGDHGDLPLEEGAGQVIADFLVEERAPAVLDLSLLTKGKQRAFMTDFAERLYHRNREALHLVLDEADAFAPQKPPKGAERLLGAVEDLVRRGRARGLGVTLVTQRSAVLNKDVLTQVEVLVALRTTSPQDRNAIKAWIDYQGEEERAREVLGSLPSLPVGTAWVWSPAWLGELQRVKVRKRETFDSSATPKAGETALEPRKLAKVDLERLRERMEATVEKAKAEDPKELRRRIRGLEKELAAARADKPEPEVREVEVPVLSEEIVARVEGIVRGAKEAGASLAAACDELGEQLARAQRPVPADVPTPPRATPTPPTAAAAAPAEERGLEGGPRKILEALARRHPMKVTRAQLGTLSGYTARGGTFQKYFSILKREGFLVERGGEVEVTQDGLDYLGVIPEAPQTPDEMLEMWRAALEGGPRRLLDVLVEHQGPMTRQELGELTGYEASGGTFQKYLSILKRNNLVVVEGGTVSPSELLVG